MTFLSLDASTKYSVLALSDERGLIYGSRRLFEKRSSQGLMTLLMHCLKKTKLNLEEIDYFGVGVGPGSFTGLRIGLSTVKGLSYALHKRCFVFSSLDAIAFNQAPYQKNRLCVIVDAKRSNVYCRFYAMDFSRRLVWKTMRRETEDVLLPITSLWKKIDGDIAFCGDALHLYKDEFVKRSGKAGHFQFIPQDFWYPTPESISWLTREGFGEGKSFDCFGLSAVYLYEQDCQVRKIC